MKKTQNAVAALLGEYEKAILELQNVIADIPKKDLSLVVDNLTANPDCRSIQTILAHAVSSGYSYCIYIQKLKKNDVKHPGKVLRFSIAEYKKDLEDVLQFTYDTFSDIVDDELEEPDNTKKIKTSWGQQYDIEQIMEHAIVHILRHRRQIEIFKSKLVQ
ncbi:MAG TPA: hypothetical protein VK498_03820 [Ferruginibacter sp.]|nr:hypothetical protein [Ferruginibacter sp.]